MAPQVPSRSGLGYPLRASDPLVVDSGHEQALAPLLVLLLDGTVGGTFTDVLVSFCLALEVVEDRSNCHLTRGMAGGDVKELLSGPQTLAAQCNTPGV